MKKPKRPVFYMLVFTGLILFLFLAMQVVILFEFQDYIAFLFPKGIIGVKERNLLLIIQALMLLVVIPVYVLTFIFSWRYRADNPQGVYDPDLIDNVFAEIIWWGFPLIMTLIVGVLTWVKTAELDPFKPIESEYKEMTIQVVALQWKWLFLYPEEKIASVNFLHIPVNVPVRFEITADAPMNSFWIPSLGGQIYAMPKMRSVLNLIANEEGDFMGSSANLSGEGFADMHFITRASQEQEYLHWIQAAQGSSHGLDFNMYEQLAKPSIASPGELFKLQDGNLFQQIINKYMHPMKEI
ncbi:MAG: COX aromatic rich motif-containing protein [Candidatus Protochlamydia sp.]|nr:COX aromatic rich motif-containing protein [Candidatus Protochlamydia sp.]